MASGGAERKEVVMQAPASDDRFNASLTEQGRYRLLVEAVRDYAIYMLDPAGLVTSWNVGAQRFNGYEGAEILGEHFSRFYTEEDRDAGRPEKALEMAADKGRFEGESWRLRKDGTKFWASIIIDRISDPRGNLVGFAAISRDLTERKAVEASLRRSEEQFRRLVQGVTDYSIFLLEPDGRVATWNAGAQRIKGYRPDEIIGEHFSRFYTRGIDKTANLKRRWKPQPGREGSKRKAGASARTESASGPMW